MFLINTHAILCALRDPTRWVIFTTKGIYYVKRIIDSTNQTTNEEE